MEGNCYFCEKVKVNEAICIKACGVFVRKSQRNRLKLKKKYLGLKKKYLGLKKKYSQAKKKVPS